MKQSRPLFNLLSLLIINAVLALMVPRDSGKTVICKVGGSTFICQRNQVSLMKINIYIGVYNSENKVGGVFICRDHCI